MSVSKKIECDLEEFSFILVAATDLFSAPFRMTFIISPALTTNASVASCTKIPRSLSSFTFKFVFEAV